MTSRRPRVWRNIRIGPVTISAGVFQALLSLDDYHERISCQASDAFRRRYAWTGSQRSAIYPDSPGISRLGRTHPTNVYGKTDGCVCSDQGC